MLAEPVAFFIPEHILDPSRRPEGQELWIEVTIPKKGPPRPIRLGVKKATARLSPWRLDRIVQSLLVVESEHASVIPCVRFMSGMRQGRVLIDSNEQIDNSAHEDVCE